MVAIFGNVYNKLESIFQSCGGQCIVYSAFAHNYTFLIKSEKPAVGMTVEQMNLVAEATQCGNLQSGECKNSKHHFPGLKIV